VVNVFTDSSLFKWGGYLTIDGKEQKFGDSWPREMSFLPIMVLEAKALLNVLNSIRESIRGCTFPINFRLGYNFEFTL
jgi:hypothetical protein